MNGLRLKHVSLPERCEVCHQKDCFDPSANYCLRCASITALMAGESEPSQKALAVTVCTAITLAVYTLRDLNTSIGNIMLIGSMIGGFFGILIGSLVAVAVERIDQWISRRTCSK